MIQYLLIPLIMELEILQVKLNTWIIDEDRKIEELYIIEERAMDLLEQAKDIDDFMKGLETNQPI